MSLLSNGEGTTQSNKKSNNEAKRFIFDFHHNKHYFNLFLSSEHNEDFEIHSPHSHKFRYRTVYFDEETGTYYEGW